MMEAVTGTGIGAATVVVGTILVLAVGLYVGYDVLERIATSLFDALTDT